MRTELIICQEGAVERLAEIVAERRSRRVFLVTGNASYPASGAEALIAKALEPCAVERFCGFGENPALDDITSGIERFCAFGPDLVVAVGGGSPLDMAKSINVLAAQDGDAIDFIEGRSELQPRGCPLVAVPTTAGSGSQVTHFAAVWVGRTKHSLAHPCMRPEFALVDPRLLASLPSHVAAGAGLDALNQGIESYWSIHATQESQDFAREAIECVIQHLVRFVVQPDDASRMGMARGAHLAGEAIERTKTTAPHAISYPITSHFGIPHGQAVGLILPSILRFNAGVTAEDCLHPLGTHHVQDTLRNLAILLGAEEPHAAADRYETLLDEIGLSRDWTKLGLAGADVQETIVAHGFDPKRVNNNPRRLTEVALREMLDRLGA
ncbi:MAG: phosphonoacetaldehyde reductase [bacterium]|nr:phosphonoacetaldehyde reductase [bacterium]